MGKHRQTWAYQIYRWSPEPISISSGVPLRKRLRCRLNILRTTNSNYSYSGDSWAFISALTATENLYIKYKLSGYLICTNILSCKCTSITCCVFAVVDRSYNY